MLKAMVIRKEMEKFYTLQLLFFLSFLFISDVEASIKLPKRYNPHKIAKVSEAKPGYVAWSPDGTRLSYVNKGITIHDIETGKKWNAKIKNAYFMHWISNDRLSVLFEESQHKIAKKREEQHFRYFLGIVDAKTLTVEKIGLKKRPLAVYSLANESSLLVLTYEAERTKIGIETSYGLIKYGLETREAEEIFFTSSTHFGKYELHSMSGWVIAGLNPVDTKTLYLEYRDPPAVNPYLKVNSVDYETGKMKSVKRIDNHVLYIQGSRSPDGSRIALTDVDGRLFILEADGSLTRVADTLEGQYPSWNPAGSQIFFGGYLVNSDGKSRAPIIPNRPESIATWSPDGTALVIVIGKTLWLLEGFEPYFVPPDGGLTDDIVEKARKLRELLDEGLIDENDYEERYRKLLNHGDRGTHQ